MREVPLVFRGRVVGTAALGDDPKNPAIYCELDPNELVTLEYIDIFWEGMSDGLVLDTYHKLEKDEQSKEEA